MVCSVDFQAYYFKNNRKNVFITVVEINDKYEHRNTVCENILHMKKTKFQKMINWAGLNGFVWQL